MKLVKGISPLVATVLLIVTTMTIAGILGVWATGFVRQTLPPSDECRFADFDVYSYNYNSTSKNMIVYLINRARVTLNITGIEFYYPEPVRYDINQLLPADNYVHTYNIANVTDGFTSFRIITNCPNVERTVAVR